jgi:hypothetical protein
VKWLSRWREAIGQKDKNKKAALPRAAFCLEKKGFSPIDISGTLFE